MPFDATRPPLTNDERTTLDNLRELERVLDEAPDRDFNMNHWYRNIPEGASDGSCRTTGCLLGWAAQDSYFRDRGLGVTPCAGEYNIKFCDEQNVTLALGYEAGDRLLPAASDELGSEYIFHPNSYRKLRITKDEVRGHIHEVRERVLTQAAARIAAR